MSDQSVNRTSADLQPYLRPRIAGGVAGHSETLPEMHGQPSGFQLNYRRDAHQAVGRDLHQAESGKTWRLVTEQAALCGAEQALTVLVHPAPQPVERAVTAPGVICRTGNTINGRLRLNQNTSDLRKRWNDPEKLLILTMKAAETAAN